MNLREKNVNTSTDLTNYVLSALQYSKAEVPVSVIYALVKEGFKNMPSGNIFTAEVNPDTQLVSATILSENGLEYHVDVDLRDASIAATNDRGRDRLTYDKVDLGVHDNRENLRDSRFEIASHHAITKKSDDPRTYLWDVVEETRGFNKLGVELRRNTDFLHYTNSDVTDKVSSSTERADLDRASIWWKSYDRLGRAKESGIRYYILNGEHGYNEMNFNCEAVTKEEYDNHICTDIEKAISHDLETSQAALRETYDMGYSK